MQKSGANSNFYNQLVLQFVCCLGFVGESFFKVNLLVFLKCSFIDEFDGHFNLMNCYNETFMLL